MDKSYWNDFYKAVSADKKTFTEVDGRVLGAPNDESPFARFCLANLMKDVGTVVDVGCGNGRDSFFFSKSGVSCLGIDQSPEVINNNNSICLAANVEPFFQAGDFSSFNFDSVEDNNVSIYSRFTLHAINYEEENAFFENINSSSKINYLFIEARSTKDVLYGQGTKVGEHEFVTSHYRRFIVFSDLLERLNKDFEIIHSEENTGLSKTEVDDPCLIRVIAKKIR